MTTCLIVILASLPPCVDRSILIHSSNSTFLPVIESCLTWLICPCPLSIERIVSFYPSSNLIENAVCILCMCVCVCVLKFNTVSGFCCCLHATHYSQSVAVCTHYHTILVSYSLVAIRFGRVRETTVFSFLGSHVQ